MCGIAGVISKNEGKNVIGEMLRCMRHRGPDDSGTFSDDHAAIGMTRLAILDLSPLGHQPMQSHCKRYWIVYNGECYNFPEIRKRLEALGDRFVSHSDTEVVLQAYIRWGVACLQYMNGMFAFAIWDTHEKKLFAARDRLGIKPFYYSVQANYFVFASELKALLASTQVPFQVDAQAVHQFFWFGHVVQPRTILKNVQALPPGTSLTWQNGVIQESTYWSCEEFSDQAISYEQAKEELWKRIQQAVKLQLISDRPLGLFLSGGLDSAAVLLAMAKNGGQVKTFNIGFEENPFVKNEAEEARALANHVGASHEQLIISTDQVVSLLPHFFESLDQPSVDGLNTYLVSKYAAQAMTVALSGLGGDELFAGYSRHATLLWKGTHNKLQPLSRLFPLSLAARLPDRLANTLWRARVYGERDDFLLNYTAARTLSFSRPGILADDHVTRSMAHEYKETFAEITTAYPRDLTRRILHTDLYGFMSSMLLRDMDAVAMAHSLEVRFPLIDHTLVEFAFRLPAEYKVVQRAVRPAGEGAYSYRESGAKRILLDVMEPMLPEGFATRPKNGFKLPLHYWLSQMNPNTLRAMIFDQQQHWEDVCDPVRVKDRWHQFASGKLHGAAFWKILTFVGVISALKRAAKSV